MDMSKLKKFVDFYEIYELVANGEETISGIRDALRLEKGLSGGNLQRRIEYLSSDPPFLMVNQDRVKFEKESFAGILMELIEGLRLGDRFILSQKKDEEIQEKVRRELERKVLVASTIEVGPEEKMSDGLFLVDPEYYLDVDACVAKYGGELDSFYEELITFAKKYNIIILHDNAYSDIIYGGRVGKSFLSFRGARDVGVEFYSLSKSYNYTGARMSFVVGNQAVIDKFKNVRSQIDYGIFLPVQYGAIAALTGPQDAVKAQCEEYDRRNHALSEGLTSIGWKVPLSQGTMFSWAHIPKGFANSNEFVMELMEKTGLIVTPGSSFGSLGEGFVRFALVLDVPTIQEAVRSVKESGILNSRM